MLLFAGFSNTRLLRNRLHGASNSIFAYRFREIFSLIRAFLIFFFSLRRTATVCCDHLHFPTSSSCVVVAVFRKQDRLWSAVRKSERGERRGKRKEEGAECGKSRSRKKKERTRGEHKREQERLCTNSEHAKAKGCRSLVFFFVKVAVCTYVVSGSSELFRLVLVRRSVPTHVYV